MNKKIKNKSILILFTMIVCLWLRQYNGSHPNKESSNINYDMRKKLKRLALASIIIISSYSAFFIRKKLKNSAFHKERKGPLTINLFTLLIGIVPPGFLHYLLFLKNSPKLEPPLKKIEEEVIEEEVKDEEVKDEEVKDEEVKDEEVKDDEVKDEEVKDDEVKDEEVKDEEVKDDEVKDEEVKDDEVKDDEVKDEEVKDDEVKDEEVKDDEVKDDEVKDDEVKDEEVKDDEVKDDEVKDDEVKEEDNDLITIPISIWGENKINERQYTIETVQNLYTTDLDLYMKDIFLQIIESFFSLKNNEKEMLNIKSFFNEIFTDRRVKTQYRERLQKGINKCKENEIENIKSKQKQNNPSSIEGREIKIALISLLNITLEKYVKNKNPYYEYIDKFNEIDQFLDILKDEIKKNFTINSDDETDILYGSQIRVIIPSKKISLLIKKLCIESINTYIQLYGLSLSEKQKEIAHNLKNFMERFSSYDEMSGHIEKEIHILRSNENNTYEKNKRIKDLLYDLFENLVNKYKKNYKENN